MSFCRKCGAELHDSADFCANCGAKVDKSLAMAANQTSVPSRAYPNNALNMGTIRKMQIAEADNVYHYFMAKKDQYREMPKILSSILLYHCCNSQLDSEKTRPPTDHFGSTGGLVFFGRFLQRAYCFVAMP